MSYNFGGYGIISSFKRYFFDAKSTSAKPILLPKHFLEASEILTIRYIGAINKAPTGNHYIYVALEADSGDYVYGNLPFSYCRHLSLGSRMRRQQYILDEKEDDRFNFFLKSFRFREISLSNSIYKDKNKISFSKHLEGGIGSNIYLRLSYGGKPLLLSFFELVRFLFVRPSFFCGHILQINRIDEYIQSYSIERKILSIRLNKSCRNVLIDCQKANFISRYLLDESFNALYRSVSLSFLVNNSFYASSVFPDIKLPKKLHITASITRTNKAMLSSTIFQVSGFDYKGVKYVKIFNNGKWGQFKLL